MNTINPSFYPFSCQCSESGFVFFTSDQRSASNSYTEMKTKTEYIKKKKKPTTHTTKTKAHEKNRLNIACAYADFQKWVNKHCLDERSLKR